VEAAPRGAEDRRLGDVVAVVLREARSPSAQVHSTTTTAPSAPAACDLAPNAGGVGAHVADQLRVADTSVVARTPRRLPLRRQSSWRIATEMPNTSVGRHHPAVTSFAASVPAGAWLNTCRRGGPQRGRARRCRGAMNSRALAVEEVGRQRDADDAVRADRRGLGDQPSRAVR
jgi:hypothetical protein